MLVPHHEPSDVPAFRRASPNWLLDQPPIPLTHCRPASLCHLLDALALEIADSRARVKTFIPSPWVDSKGDRMNNARNDTHWKLAVLELDNWVCQVCGSPKH